MAHPHEPPDELQKVPGHTRLHRRGSRYYIRAKVPTDLQSVMKRKELKKSLKTSDYREAVRLVKLESSRFDALFDDCAGRCEPWFTKRKAALIHERGTGHATCVEVLRVLEGVSPRSPPLGNPCGASPELRKAQEFRPKASRAFLNSRGAFSLKGGGREQEDARTMAD